MTKSTRNHAFLFLFPWLSLKHRFGGCGHGFGRCDGLDGFDGLGRFDGFDGFSGFSGIGGFDGFSGFDG